MQAGNLVNRLDTFGYAAMAASEQVPPTTSLPVWRVPLGMQGHDSGTKSLLDATRSGRSSGAIVPLVKQIEPADAGAAALLPRRLPLAVLDKSA